MIPGMPKNFSVSAPNTTDTLSDTGNRFGGGNAINVGGFAVNTNPNFQEEGKALSVGVSNKSVYVAGGVVVALAVAWFVYKKKGL